MILAGDEFGRTQRGNNNAYCQDNEISWVDWAHDERGESLIEFVRRLSALRSHYPVLRQSRFLQGAWNEELKIKDSTWLTPTGEEMTAAALAGRQRQNAAAYCSTAAPRRAAFASAAARRRCFWSSMPTTTWWFSPCRRATGGRDWRRLVDTNLPDEDEEFDSAAMFKFWPSLRGDWPFAAVVPVASAKPHATAELSGATPPQDPDAIAVIPTFWRRLFPVDRGPLENYPPMELSGRHPIIARGGPRYCVAAIRGSCEFA